MFDKFAVKRGKT